MESSSQDRNLPASERKLKKAREEGQVTRSRDLLHVAVLGAGSLTLIALGAWFIPRLQLQLEQQLAFDARTLREPATMFARLQDMVLPSLGLSAGVAFMVAAAAIVGSVVVGGWVSSATPIQPDFSRVNPLAGLQRLFTKDKLADVAKLALVTTVLLLLGAHYIQSSLPQAAALILQPSAAALDQLMEWLRGGLVLLLTVVAGVAVVDVPLQRYLHRQRLKMSQEEMKQEHKESDGNPQVKGKLRQRQRDIAQRTSVRKVPQADFVLMNPTHYAVALRYEEHAMQAPRVIAKGADLLALRIRDIAKQHTIPVLESPKLARALYAHAELDKDIPVTLFTAVAQVLAYVYRLKAAMRGEGKMPGDLPQPHVPPELDPLRPSNPLDLARGADA